MFSVLGFSPFDPVLFCRIIVYRPPPKVNKPAGPVPSVILLFKQFLVSCVQYAANVEDLVRINMPLPHLDLGNGAADNITPGQLQFGGEQLCDDKNRLKVKRIQNHAV